MERNAQLNTFMVVKDGYQFHFARTPKTDINEKPSKESILNEYFLDHVVCKVKILPQKHKQIKNPLHFYGELVKTKMGTNYLRG